MQRLQRTMGRALPRTADESQVAVLLQDFEDVDSMLDRLIAASRSWRDAWKQILMRQQKIAAEYDGLYNPIIGASKDYHGPAPADTPEHLTLRVMKLAREYAELESDMKEEVDEMDLRVIRPAEEAKASIQPMKKVIKKRQDRKLDWERYQGRYDSSAKKIGRSERETRAHNKHEGDMSRSKEEYAEADAKIRECLPPLLTTVFSLLPYILAAQITIQNNLLGHCYTQINEFCEQEGFPIPAPAMDALVSSWEGDFNPAKNQVEAIKLLRKGKAIHQPMRSATWASEPAVRRPTPVRSPSYNVTDASSLRPSSRSPSANEPSTPGGDMQSLASAPLPNLANKPSLNRVSSSQSLQSTQSAPGSALSYEHGRQRMLSVPDQGSLSQAMPNYAKLARLNGSITPDTLSAISPAGPNADYFSRSRLSSNNFSSPPALSPASTIAPSSASSMASTLAAAAAAKKKPPPPPGPKPRIPSVQYTFVTALYDYTGQSNGDLTFREGDKIKVIKRTESTQDWWEGELAGVRGSFPANYCQVA